MMCFSSRQCKLFGLGLSLAGVYTCNNGNDYPVHNKNCNCVIKFNFVQVILCSNIKKPWLFYVFLNSFLES